MKKNKVALTGLAVASATTAGLMSFAGAAHAQTGNTGNLPTTPYGPSNIAANDGAYGRLVCLTSNPANNLKIQVTTWDQGNVASISNWSGSCVPSYNPNMTATVQLDYFPGNGFSYNNMKWTVGGGSSPNSQTAYRDCRTQGC